MMIFDYGIFFSKKVSVCLCRGWMIVGSKAMLKVVEIEVTDRSHLFLDRGAGARRSYVERVVSDPREILKTQGDAKVNLKLYVSFATGGRYKPDVGGNRRQKMIRDIIEGKRSVWRRIAARDFHGYRKLAEALGVGVDVDRKTVLKARIADMVRSSAKDMCESETIRSILASEKDLPDKVCIALRAHHDICTKSSRSCVLEAFGREYSRMVEMILGGRVDGDARPCGIDHPFYGEVALFNMFVRCRDSLLDFDTQALEKDVFHTTNERGIRDFVAGEVERFLAVHGAPK